jgi:hypothetical protein
LAPTTAPRSTGGAMESSMRTGLNALNIDRIVTEAVK